MSVEELLKPRYKVIADWPGMANIVVGDVLMETLIFSKPGWYVFKGDGFDSTRIHGPEFYPHLFKKLEWYEDREVSEMPEYVKYDAETSGVMKVTKWHIDKDDIWFDADGNPNGFSTVYTQPATKEEYDLFIKLKK